MALQISVKGQEEIRKKLDELARKYPRALAGALYQEGAELLSDSLRRVPVEFGVLRSSGYVAPPTGLEEPVVEIGYGTDYAVPVHERTGAHHEVGEAKYLERAVDARTGGMLERIAKWTIDNEKRGIGMQAIPGVPREPKPDWSQREKGLLKKGKQRAAAKQKKLKARAKARSKTLKKKR